MRWFKNFIEYCEEIKISFGLWMCTALSIIFVRDSIETVVVDRTFPFVHPFHLVHYPLFFISILLATIVILHFFSKEEILKVSRLSLIFFAIIIFPPTMDFFISLITKAEFSYSYVQDNLLENFIGALNPFFKMSAVPASVRIEGAIILILSFVYIQMKRRNVFLSIAGVISIYLIFFLYGALPGIFVNLYVFFRPIIFFLLNSLNRFFGGPATAGAGGIVKSGEGILDDPIILINELLLTLIAAVIWFLRYDKNKAMVLFKNLRLSRSIHYLLMVIIGLWIYFSSRQVTDLFIFLKVASILFATFFAFQFAVVINDIFDVEGDSISNKGRPLIIGAMDKNEYLKVGLVYLAFALLFAFFVGDYCFTILLFSVALSVLYSAPPFRLKRFFPLSSALIGLEALVALIFGQVSLDREGALDFSYLPFWTLIFLAFFLGSNIRDLKDIEGDRRSGVYSLPVLAGEVESRRIIACFVFLSYLLVPFFLYRSPVLDGSLSFFVFSFFYGLCNLFYIIRPEAKEKIIFFLYFIYVFLILFLIKG